MALSKVNPNFVSQLGRRNLIINGAMNVAQRGSTFTAPNGAYTLDRFQVYQANGAVFDVNTSTDAPDGFSNSLELDCTTAASSPASGAYVQMVTRIEGQDLQELAYGTSSAKKITLSFWVKSNKTGTYQVNFRKTQSTAQMANKTYTINTADTWEYKSVTVDGATGFSLVTDNTQGLMIDWWYHSGTNFSSGSGSETYIAFSNTNYNNYATATLGDNTSNYLRMTGVQLEVGDTATDFEHRSFGEEFAACQRYFYLMGSGTTFGSAQSGSGAYTRMYAQPARHPVAMRADPSFSFITGGSSYFVSGGGITVGTPTGDAGTVQNSVHTFYSLNTTKTGFNRLSIGAGFTFTRGQSYGNTSDFIEVSAEL
jgi:hypothetical protein